MRFRLIAIAAICLALALPGAASASSGPKRMQALAAAQTFYLFAHLTGDQHGSPSICGAGQPSSGFFGFFLLPTLSFSSGSQVFRCRITTPRVVLDLGGITAIEDASNVPYEFEEPTTEPPLLFVPRNLERICDDVRTRYFETQPSSAKLDGVAIAGTAVTTPVFPVPIHRTAPLTFWDDSVKLGHPGVLASTFCGWKAELTLTRGRHEIVVNHSGLFGGVETEFTYVINVS